MLIFAFQVYVLGRWVSGPYFVATDPGVDTITAFQKLYFLLLQIGVPCIAMWMFWHYLLQPWRRERQITTDGRLIAAFFMIFFWDMSMNYASTVLFYNSYFFNRGAWSLGSWPFWFSPAANRLPEPLFISIPGYTTLVFSQVLFICWLLRKAKQRKPDLGIFQILGAVIIGSTVVDSLVEVLLIRSGVYAYPGAIRSLTLFAGKTYQFPMTEGFLFGGLGIGSVAALSFCRDDKGLTWAEQGIDHVRLAPAGKQWLRFFAVFGFVQGAFLGLYAVPNQWISLNADEFPTGYPSYMENGMCVYGEHRDHCPGPGVMMPRPPYAAVPR